MSLLKVVVGLHAIWLGYLGIYDFFNFYFSIRRKIKSYLQIPFGVSVILQIYFSTLSIFDLIGLSNISDVHNLNTFQGIYNFKFVVISLGFSVIAYFIRRYAEKGDYDMRNRIDARI